MAEVCGGEGVDSSGAGLGRWTVATDRLCEGRTGEVPEGVTVEVIVGATVDTSRPTGVAPTGRREDRTLMAEG